MYVKLNIIIAIVLAASAAGCLQGSSGVDLAAAGRATQIEGSADGASGLSVGPGSLLLWFDNSGNETTKVQMVLSNRTIEDASSLHGHIVHQATANGAQAMVAGHLQGTLEGLVEVQQDGKRYAGPSSPSLFANSSLQDKWNVTLEPGENWIAVTPFETRATLTWIAEDPSWIRGWTSTNLDRLLVRLWHSSDPDSFDQQTSFRAGPLGATIVEHTLRMTESFGMLMATTRSMAGTMEWTSEAGPGCAYEKRFLLPSIMYQAWNSPPTGDIKFSATLTAGYGFVGAPVYLFALEMPIDLGPQEPWCR